MFIMGRMLSVSVIMTSVTVQIPSGLGTMSWMILATMLLSLINLMPSDRNDRLLLFLLRVRTAENVRREYLYDVFLVTGYSGREDVGREHKHCEALWRTDVRRDELRTQHVDNEGFRRENTRFEEVGSEHLGNHGFRRENPRVECARSHYL
ncbi:hypothetical protein PMAYCL1PPCAC_03631, partial [Pristionchus mayeri]